MAELGLSSSAEFVDTTNDSIVIMKMIDDITGGKVLDTTGFADDVISAGHGVIQEDGTENYKPLPVTGVIPASHTAVGVVIGSVLTKYPAVGVMIRGKVNEEAAKYPFSAAFKTALPLITFTKD